MRCSSGAGSAGRKEGAEGDDDRGGRDDAGSKRGASHRSYGAIRESVTHPHDPDARITKMKDGRTHLAYRAEHTVDMETGAIVAVTLHGADVGDTATIQETVAEAEIVKQVSTDGRREVVTDKGNHSRAVVSELAEWGVRTYCSEPNRGRQRWP